MESTTIEYEVERNCNVSKVRLELHYHIPLHTPLSSVSTHSYSSPQVGPLLDSKGYGIAMKKSESYSKILSLSISLTYP